MGLGDILAHKILAAAQSAAAVGWLDGIVMSILGVPSLYGDGADGALAVTSNTSISGVKQYTSIDISNSSTLTSSTTKGSLILLVNGTVTIGAGSAISTVGRADNGGNSGHGGFGLGPITGQGGGSSISEAQGGAVTNELIPFFDTVDASGSSQWVSSTTGDGSNAHRWRRIIWALPQIFYLAADDQLYGSGGGGNGGLGGHGSTGIILICKELNNSGTITADGGDVESITNSGGGGAGTIFIYTPKQTSLGTISVSGGAQYGTGHSGGSGWYIVLP